MRNVYYWDTACGPYAINGSARQRLDANSDEKRRIAWSLAQRASRGLKLPVLVVGQPVAAPKEGEYSVMSVDELLGSISSSPVEMIEAALLNIAGRLSHPSEAIRLAPEDCWKVYAFDSASMAYVITQLCQMGFIKDQGADPSSSFRARLYSVEAPGWEKISALQRLHSASIQRQAFVAMWFTPDTEQIFSDGIAPAVSALGYLPVRIDRKEHNNKICDEIIVEIKRSRFVVADFTGNRGGVYYEAGFAHGRGIPVIWTVRENDLANVHFDTRQYNHLVFSSPTDLREKLLNRISATIA